MIVAGADNRPPMLEKSMYNSWQNQWSKFVIDVKLEKNMHTSNYDQLYAYLSKHEAHATKVRLTQYYETRTPEVSNNSVANTLNNKVTPSSSSIIVEEHEAPQLVSSSGEPIANEPTTLVSNDNADESV
nr:hypothetical protein [Tanacetum cinerariifolium]